MKSNGQRGRFIGLFGLMFMLAGFIAFYATAGAMIVGYVSTSKWVEVAASVHELELTQGSGDSSTYSVKGRYSYQYNGASYNNDRVSLSVGRDNIGSYWQDLYTSLRADRSSNESSVYVNPDNPSESVLDRSFRWESIGFGAIFLIVFGGSGGFLFWSTFRRLRPRLERLKAEKYEGIVCKEKLEAWLLAGLGGLFFLISTVVLVSNLTALLKGENYVVLVALIFLIASIAMMVMAVKSLLSYRKFGPAPLFLDPEEPGIGGQLGGSFTIRLKENYAYKAYAGNPQYLRATLSCTRLKRGRKSSYRIKLWKQDKGVFLQTSSRGIKGVFVFDIPKDCIAAEHIKIADWKVEINGDLGSGLGKFERSWDVVVREQAINGSSTLSIPAAFVQKSRQASRAFAESSALDQIAVTEEGRFLCIKSRAGRYAIADLLFMVTGGLFAAIGVLSVQADWSPGYLFLLAGVAMSLSSLYVLGKAVETKIDTTSWELYSTTSWMSRVLSEKQGKVLDAEQFTIKKVSGNQTGKTHKEYYVLNFESRDGTIRLADRIKGRKAAEALEESITKLVFAQESYSKTA